mgnify:CR=1 FL=1
MLGIKTALKAAEKVLNLNGWQGSTFGFGIEDGKLIKSESVFGNIYASLQGWSFRAIDIRASKFATINHHVYQYNSKTGDVEEIFDHPLVDLLENPSKTLDKFSFYYLGGCYMAIFGEVPIWIVGGQRPEEIIPLNPSNLQNKPGDDSHYQYTDAGKVYAIPREEIIFIRKPNPSLPGRGLSAVKAAGAEIDLDLLAQTWNKGIMRDNGRLEGVLTTDKAPTEEVIEGIKKRWNKEYSSPSGNKTVILGAGLKYQQLSISPRDLDMIEGRKLNRDMILSILGVPKALVVADDVNRANAEVAHNVMAEYTIDPDMAAFTSAFNHFIVPIFDLKLWITYDSPIRQDRALLLEEVKSLVDFVMTKNEARARYNLPAVEGGDKLYVQLNLDEVAEVESATKKETTQIDIRFKSMISKINKRNRLWNKNMKGIKPVENKSKKQALQLSVKQHNAS